MTFDWTALAGSRVIDLAQPMRRGMPQSPNHPPFQMSLVRRHGDYIRDDGSSAANELIVTGGHVGTHVDALAHVSHRGRLHGDVDAFTVTSHEGFGVLGIDEFVPYVGRCVLLDVARVHGTETLPPGYGVTAADLAAAEKASGTEVRPGDAVLVGTGWSRLWDRREEFVGAEAGVPGPDESAAEWLIQAGARLAGGETIAFEQIKPGAGHALLPVHRMFLVDHGINIVETMRLTELLDTGVGEFLLVLAPLNVVGATGAPARPLAVVAAT
ncbi:cyclase family protein [Yinghuangia seranimata]|uniref:cyclase family protein n=1 Tax=Yinghuangia seranimata TaxID=408067 RepID=UPI00248BB757|nr:cyclase family protein [Yinghuangia seranimata]MDI2132435.1 cyclase family protein [Yinghuangia seranimata]